MNKEICCLFKWSKRKALTNGIFHFHSLTIQIVLNLFVFFLCFKVVNGYDDATIMLSRYNYIADCNPSQAKAENKKMQIKF